MEPMLLVLTGAALALGAVLLGSHILGFVAQRPADFAGQGPVLNLRDHLAGPLLCEGVIYGPTGRVVSRFVAEMEAHWHGNVGTMTEEFRYDSGAVQHRQWTLHVEGDDRIRAEAPDVVGTGHGELCGPALRLRYRIRLPDSAGGYVLDTTDWMYVVENGTIINRSQFRKYGFKVAELIATIRKNDR
ncbi:DUF3833 domain-containing protein [Plastorhodobacter daqingensis]|uniref:DUF3833 domain-containing protein n=1 Tax=Plastorhodobacter daqingensis TaxID=1387281 RepID=A0ABW2ULX7_9RHOB